MDEPIPLSALQHAVYCLRQAALIHLERLWAENRFTAEGQVLHVHVDKPMGRAQRGVRRVTALPLASREHGDELAAVDRESLTHATERLARLMDRIARAARRSTPSTRCYPSFIRC
jgi:hypothetical protein